MRDKLYVVLLAAGMFCMFVGGLMGARALHLDRLHAEQRKQAQDLFCDRARDNIDTLRAERSEPTFRDRVAGAEWFVVNAVRLCTGDDQVPDLGDAIVAGNNAAIDAQLTTYEMRLSH